MRLNLSDAILLISSGKKLLIAKMLSKTTMCDVLYGINGGIEPVLNLSQRLSS
jgi:hypothetical protein